MKNNKYTQAFQSAEQEIEEKSIAQLKQTIKQILQKKKDLEEDRDEIDEEIKLLKQDIEDFKAGRLDKVKERHENDERADKVFPITINIIKQEVVTKPWTWTYEVMPKGIWTTALTPDVTGSSTYSIATSLGGTNAICLTGNSAQTFTTGSYTLTGGIVNL